MQTLFCKKKYITSSIVNMFWDESIILNYLKKFRCLYQHYTTKHVFLQNDWINHTFFTTSKKITLKCLRSIKELQT